MFQPNNHKTILYSMVSKIIGKLNLYCSSNSVFTNTQLSLVKLEALHCGEWTEPSDIHILSSNRQGPIGTEHKMM
jgi:hypothetical protein